MSKIAVIAFGGNALLRGEQRGTINEQIENARETCINILKLIGEGYNIILTHGNGPQVGNLLLDDSAGTQVYGVPEMPIDVCVAYSQGFIGYILEQQLKNVLNENGINKNVVTIINQVVVDKNDPAFQKPTKPVGPFYDKETYEKLAEKTGDHFVEDPRKRGWRKVVASPKPLDICNKEIIKELADKGNIVIAVGGGGIPVYRDENNNLHGIEAVIDKDLASALLAAKINADRFYILTDVSKVCLNFHKPNQIELNRLSVKEAKQYLSENHFAEGSMAPKIKAVISFVENSNHEAIITSNTNFKENIDGTVIYP